MKITLSWLKRHLDTNSSIKKICHKLTDIGLEIEDFESDNSEQKNFFRFATIKSIQPHPNADKLQICQVDVGEKNLLQVICGAKNAKKGLTTIYAPIGSIIPANNLKIKKSQIRGIDSYGMLCSESELGFSEESEGIIEINQKVIDGENIKSIFPKDHLIDINITPNRGDCLGVFGIARDLAATKIGTLTDLPKINLQEEGSSIKVTTQTSKCPYISVRNISEIKNQPSPIWLKSILNKIGLTSHNAVIDVANYVMLTTGNPIHIYDCDKISNQQINITELQESQTIKSLKDENLTLEKGDIIATDKNDIITLSGIIGAKNSLVTTNSKNIIIEAASFNKDQISQTSRRLKINSDSKYRFERGVDLKMIDYAVDYTAFLIQELCGGKVGKKSSSGNKDETKKFIELNIENIQKFIGIKIEKLKILSILESLHFEFFSQSDNIFQITPPSFRNDIVIERDIIEEIVRIYGFNQIKPRQPENFQLGKNKLNWKELASQKLIKNDFNESINWSFIKKQDFEIFSEINEDLRIANPISSDMEYMRITLLPSLIKIAKNNFSKGFTDISIFEIGKVFDGKDFLQTKDSLCALRSGFNSNKNPHGNRRKIDALDLKKDLLDCLEVFNIKEDSLSFIEYKIPSYFNRHKSSTVKLGNKIIAYVGEIHPLIANKFNISQPINIFELLVNELPPIKNRKSSEFIANDLPIVNRDFCFILNNDANISEVKKEIKKSDQLISKVRIFDIYLNNKDLFNQKSIAFNIEISPNKKTLTLEEIENISSKIIKNISLKFQGKIRDIASQ